MNIFKFTLASSIVFAMAMACTKTASETVPTGVPPVQTKTATSPNPKDEPTQGASTNKGKEKEEEREQAAVSSSLAIIVDGKPSGEWTVDKLRGLASSKGGSEDMRWSLRDATTTLVGANARVIAVLAQGNRLEIEPKQWSDASRHPILRVNRKGDYKFQWEGGDSISNLSELRQLTGIEIKTSGKMP